MKINKLIEIYIIVFITVILVERYLYSIGIIEDEYENIKNITYMIFLILLIVIGVVVAMENSNKK